MGSLSPTHWLIVIVALVLLFGATKLPQMARSLGQSARILRAEARGLKDDDDHAQRDKQSGTDAPQQLSSGDQHQSATPTTEQNRQKDQHGS